jgi:hypothetical protein
MIFVDGIPVVLNNTKTIQFINGKTFPILSTWTYPTISPQTAMGWVE